MDATFTFPPQNIAVPRPSNASAGSTGDPIPRESEALRASVLDAALELGFSSNSLVSDWMFNDAPDEPYLQTISSPTLTHGSSPNSDTSPSSSPPFPYTPSTSSPTSSSQSHNLYYLKFDPAAAENPANPSQTSVPRISESDSLTPLRARTDVKSPTPTFLSRPVTPVSGRKLKKKRTDDDDSDGGYLSEGPTRKKDKKKDTAVTKQASFIDLKERAKAAKVQAKEEKLLEKKKKEDESKRQKAAKKALDKETAYGGYETDGGVKSPSTPKKTKSKAYSGDGGYETDAGYHSATPKRKNTFFGLRSKSSRSDVQYQEPLPILPTEKEKEFMPLPIAERFATTLLVSPKVSISSEGTFMPSRGGTPMPDSPQVSTSSHISAPQPSSTYDRLAPERASHSSGESSATGTTNSKRRGVQFSPTSSQTSHGRGGGSFSTITSVSQVPPPPPPSSPGSQPPRSPSRQNSRRSSLVKFLNISPFPSTRSPSPDPTNTLGRRPSASAFPAISYPVTRSLSPVPRSLSPDPDPPRPITPLMAPNTASKMKLKPTLTTSTLNVNVNANPDLLSSDPFASVAHSPSVYSPRSPARPRFGPRVSSTSTSPANYLQPIVVPPPLSSSSSSSISSSNPSPLPAPSVLAYYDIPPPSPPPAGPLPNVPSANVLSGLSGLNPNVPSGLSISAGAFPTLRPRVRERLIAQEQAAVQRGYEQAAVQRGHDQAAVQRGREAPFPAPLFSGAGVTLASGKKVDPPRVGERKVDRYRDLYAADSVGVGGHDRDRGVGDYDRSVGDHARSVGDHARSVGDHDRSVRFRDDGGGEGYEDSSSEGHTGVGGGVIGKALGSRHPFDANEESHFSISDYYVSAGAEDPANGRSTMYSIAESVYSRASFLDSDKSESTRERFIQRVEAMLSAEGRRVYQDIPPVPKLPEGLKVPTFTPGKNWNRF